MNLEKLIENQSFTVEEENIVIENSKKLDLDKQIRKYAKDLKEANKKEEIVKIKKQIEKISSPDIYTEQYIDDILELSFELEVEDCE